LLLAHRGDHGTAPENTLAALADSVAAGCDGMELDVRRSRDGQAIVLHDASLRRVQGVDAEAIDLTAAELATHGVPTLAALLAAAPAAFVLDVEIKEAHAVSATIEALEAIAGPDAPVIVISSFDDATLAEFARRRPAWRRWLIGTDAGAIERALELGCDGVALAVAVVDEDLVARAHALQLQVIAWTVRDAADRERLGAIGVDAICAEGAALSR
jgi:glycerophosphoryl diester phosphodiesterase